DRLLGDWIGVPESDVGSPLRCVSECGGGNAGGSRKTRPPPTASAHPRRPRRHSPTVSRQSSGANLLARRARPAWMTAAIIVLMFTVISALLSLRIRRLVAGDVAAPSRDDQPAVGDDRLGGDPA